MITLNSPRLSGPVSTYSESNHLQALSDRVSADPCSLIYPSFSIIIGKRRANVSEGVLIQCYAVLYAILTDKYP